MSEPPSEISLKDRAYNHKRCSEKVCPMDAWANGLWRRANVDDAPGTEGDADQEKRDGDYDLLGEY